MTSQLLLPFKCKVIVPDPSTPISDSVSRWSDSNLDRPALVVIPNSAEDVVDAIHYAENNGLRLIPGGGGHGSFVPIDAKTLYLDLKKFDSIVIDKTNNVAQFGGGVLTGAFFRKCVDEGFYTTCPNSSAVGMTGFILGGGNNPLIGLHGMAIDNVVSFDLISAQGKILNLSASSTGEELALFNALCGGGIGLGVVISVTLKIFPLAGLKMTDNQPLTRKLIFPGAAIDKVATIYANLQPLAPALNVAMVFLRSPPNSPVPGTPMIMVTATYFGPAEEGEKAMGLLFDEEVVKKAIKADKSMVPFAQIISSFDAFNVHGGYKDISSAWLSVMLPSTTREIYQRWLDFTGKYDDAKKTMIALGGMNTEKMVAIGNTPEGQAKYFESRDRGVLFVVMTWYSKPEMSEPVNTFARDSLSLYRRSQPESEVPRTFANNLRPHIELEEMHTEDRIKELKRINQLWDSKAIFWSPYGMKK